MIESIYYYIIIKSKWQSINRLYIKQNKKKKINIINNNKNNNYCKTKLIMDHGNRIIKIIIIMDHGKENS